MTDGSFEVAYMEEAENFLNGLAKKVRDKIYFNITKVMGGVKDKRIKRRMNYGNETDNTCRNAQPSYR